MNFIPNKSNYLNFLRSGSGDEKASIFSACYQIVKDQMIPMRMVSAEKFEVPPRSYKLVRTIPQAETWSDDSKTYSWQDMPSADKNVIVIAKPSSSVQRTTHMDAEEEQAYYNLEHNIFVIKNHTDSHVNYGAGTNLANCFLIA